MLIPINLTGGTYKHKSLPVLAQVTRNFWPQLQQDDAVKSPYILASFPGLKLFSDTGTLPDRGMLVFGGLLYKVTGTKLYSVDSFGEKTELGTIPGLQRCILVGINESVVVVTGGHAYVWDGSNVVEITDPDLETPNSAAHLNNQIIFDGDGGRFCSSDVGDAASIDGLNYASAESDADDLLRVYVYNQILYMMGEKTIEPWWNSGAGNPPFDRMEQGIMPIGLGAIHSVANSDNYMYLLDDDNQVQAITGSTAQVVTPRAITAAISKYALVEDAVGWCMNVEGQWFYILCFPTADKTWAFPEGGEWFELSSGSDEGRYIGNSYAYIYRKHLIADYRNGNIYELDADTYDENGDEIIRRRDSGPMHGGLLGKPGKTLEMNRFELILETGVGLTTGQGSDPQIMLSYSDDGGKTFAPELWGSIGKIGEYIWKVEWFCLGSFETRIISIRFSEPVHISIHSAAADIEVGI